MILRFILSHAIEGSYQISELDGWDKATIGFTRHPDFHSLVEYFKGSFNAYGSNGSEDGGREWLKNIEKLYGVDADINILVEIDYDEDGNFVEVFTGQIAVEMFVESLNTQHLLQIVFTQNDFWTRFINRYQSQVDIRSTTDLDGNVVVPAPKFTLPLPSQKIFKNDIGTIGESPTIVFANDLPLIGANTINYFLFSFTEFPIEELETLATGYPYQMDTVSPVTKSLYFLKAKEKSDIKIKAGGNLRLDGNFPAAVPDQVTIEWFVSYGPSNGPFTEIPLAPSATGGSIAIGHLNFSIDIVLPADVSFSLAPFDEMYIYAKITYPSTNKLVDFDVSSPGSGVTSTLTIEGNTLFPDSITEAFLAHDVASAITDRTSGQSGLFYSDYLGNAFTSRIYGATGCGSLLANMKGLHIRGYKLSGDADPTKNKSFFKSMQDWWEEHNPIYNLALWYDKKDGLDIIRVERKEKVYDDSGFSIKLSNVQNITRKYDPEVQFSSIKNGSEKWQSQAASGVGTPSGIDDAQTTQTRNSRFKKVGKPLTLLSKLVTASLTIEQTRRISNLLSANYTYDDDTFGIALKSLGAGAFTPELNENFSSITNLSNSATRYNSRLTPARNFLRWLNVFSGCLQDYPTSFFKFASGEGNYKMTSTMTTSCEGDDSGIAVAENGDIEVGTDFLHLALLYEIEHEMDWNDYVTLRQNRHLAIGISQTEADHKKMFIKTLEYQIGTGIVKLEAWAKEPLDIQAIDSPTDEQIYYSTRHYEPEYEGPYE